MALGGLAVAFIAVDTLLRRLVLPIVLLTSVIVRYNLISFAYLLLLLVILLLPGPRLKAQKVTNIVYLSVLLVLSGVATLVQVFFQIALATSYKNELNSGCGAAESIWRQIGFVLFNVPAIDVIRLLLPDVIVFVASLLTLVVDVFVVIKLRPPTTTATEGEGGANGGTAENDNKEPTEIEARHVDSETGAADGALSPHSGPPYPKNIQCYWEVPKLISYIIEFGIFVMLGLAGIAVPSITSFSYYAVFLVLLVIWSVHMRLAGLVRVLRTLLTLHSALHLLMLHLFQFSTAQDHFQLMPGECNTTISNQMARLFGLTPIITTNCFRPTELLLCSNINYTVFLNPAFVFILYWLLATDFRMWLFTPQLLWRKDFSYYLPIQDESPSKSVKCVLKKSSRRSQILEGSRSYGTMGPSLLQEGTDSDASAATPSPDLVAPVLTTKEKLHVKERVWFRVKNFALGLWAAVLSITFIFTVVAMMFWSVLYPSWPSLVFLLWSCGIWLIPQLNPRDSVFYTSPVLVAYSFILLLIQYVYSLDLTMEEFRKSNDIVLECSLGRRVGCKSIALLAKTLFTVIFFASFHEFVRVMKIKIPQWWAKHKRQADGEMPLAEMHDDEDADPPNELTDSTKANEEARSNIYLSMMRLLRTYWVLAVVGAFLLVTLTGEPSALKSVYLICFFIFMITYQIATRYWFYFCYPVWWLLVLYAAVHLILIYTFPFTNHLWMNAYDDLFHPNDSISADELFKSIGFNFLEYNDIHFRTLIVTLVPPAVFIAVMALQLRFFKPRLSVATAGAQVASQAAVDIYSILPKAFRDTLSKLDEVDFGEDPDDDEEDGDDDDNGEDSDEITFHRRSPSMHSIKSSALRESHPKLYSCYRFTRYLFHKTRQIIVDLNTIFWRFMELHLHKIVVLVLFATSVSQINAAYWVLLVLVLIVVPLPYFNTLTYPIITLYLGLLCTAKMVYNLPVMSQYYLNFTEPPRQCEPIVNKVEGLVYQSIYSPLFNDTNWVGLHPAEDFAHYISLPIICVLLLSFWFSARRYQARHYESQKIVVSDYERRSLFLHVTRAEAEVSIVASLKYLVNHFFEMYGIEVCWGMLAIAVAVRIDVYGVIYAVVLGLLFLVRRSILRPIWLVYLPLHGVLLAIQYFFLLGAPPSICYNKPNTTVYPWSNLDISDNGTHFSPSAFKKWLFIPDDTREILNGHLLYADFLVYIVVCLQLMYFFRNPLEQGTRDQVDGDIPNFYEARYWIDYFKVFVFQYSFWFSLFLLFFTAAYRVSLFGIFYLLVGFYFLFRGQHMLRDRQSARHTKWSVLRFVTWITLLVRVSLQILDCVFWEKVQIFKGIDNCLLILLFNGACTEQPYYGSALPNCPDEPRNLGLWIDALNFIIISLQIIIFDTDYAEKVRDELTRRVNEAQSFREIFDSKIKEYQEAQQKKKTKEIEELVERTEKLVVSEKKIDHLLYAGVRVPEDIEIRRTRRRTSTSISKAEEDVDLVTSTSISQDITTGERERSTAKKLYDQLVEVVDWVIEQLEQGSSLYREVVFSIKESQSPTRASRESEPIALEGRTRYGSTDAPPQQPATTEVHVEVHEEAGMQDGPKAEAGDQGDKSPTEKESKKKKKKKKMKKSKSVGFDVPTTTTTGDTVIDELHIEPSVSQREEIEKFEDELEEKALKVTSRLRRLSTAIYYFLLAHSDYLVFFFIILNIILNGSVLSMVYAILLYTWGLLSIPWPTRKFWLTLIFYTMFVLVTKYAFQFHDITYWEDKFDRSSGLYPPLVLGILHRKNFFTNAVWDILLLIALLLHRGLLVQYGLWSAGPHQGIIKSFTNIFKQLWHDVKEFFTRLFDPDISQGAKDYYAVMLFFDLLCFLTIVAGVNSFGIGIQTRTVADLTAVADFVRTNNVPLLFVALLLLQFVSMVVDRAIYLRRSLPARFVFQVFLLIGWHVGLFFILPSDPLTGRPFTSNAAAQCLYFFKSCYFIASSLQIVSGYPARILGYLLTSSYNMVAWLAFLVYRLIPLLPELRETMDWTFTDTSLSLINWFKVQEIYSLIYLVKVQRTREKSYPRDLGQKQSWLVKIFAGGLVLIGLILLIWLPLLLISVIGQASEPNPPVEVDIKLSIGGFQPLVELTVQERGIYKLSESDYKRLGNLFSDIIPFPVFLREFQQDDFRRVVFPGESTSLWTISPPSREQLKVQLENIVGNPNLTLPLDFSWSIKRAPSSSSNVLETVSGITTQQLSSNSSAVKEFTDSLNSNMPSNVLVNLTNLYPTLIHAPSSQQSTNFSQLSNLINNGVSSNVSCTAILNRTGNASEEGVSEWWSLTQNSSYVVTPQIPGQLEMIIYSERVAPQIFSFISGLGIITLYVSVVLVIGRFIRTYVADLPYRLAVDEILNPDPLIRLCQDIYTVRERKDLRLEEILVGRLFYIFRSPERIVRITEDLKEKTD